MNHDELKEKALKAVNAVFGDTSVSQQQTLDSLEEIASEIDTLATGIRADMARETSEDESAD